MCQAFGCPIRLEHDSKSIVKPDWNPVKNAPDTRPVRLAESSYL